MIKYIFCLFNNSRIKFDLKFSVTFLLLLLTISCVSSNLIYAQPFLVGMHGNKIQTFNSTDYSTVSAEFPLTLPGKTIFKGNAVTLNTDNQLYYAIVETNEINLYFHIVIVDPSTGTCADVKNLGIADFNGYYSSITYSNVDSCLYFMREDSGFGIPFYGISLFKYNIATGVLNLCEEYAIASLNNNPLISYNPDDGLLYNFFSYVFPFSNSSGLTGVYLQKININDYSAIPITLSGDIPDNSYGGILYMGNGIFSLTSGDAKGYNMTTNGSVIYIADLPYTEIAGFGYSDIPLPVELASFTSSVNENNVTLNWSTASETNNSGFDIERAINTIENGQLMIDSWSKIGNVNGNGTINEPKEYSFTDRNLASGNYSYRLKQIDYNGNFEYFNLSYEVNVGVPSQFELSQNYPNPFNPTTNLEFGISELGFVTLKVYNSSGKEVATLVNEVKLAGYYTYNFNASGLSSGVYYYILKSDNISITKKMLLIK